MACRMAAEEYISLPSPAETHSRLRPQQALPTAGSAHSRLCPQQALPTAGSAHSRLCPQQAPPTIQSLGTGPLPGPRTNRPPGNRRQIGWRGGRVENKEDKCIGGKVQQHKAEA
ncbi:hypothetical protein EYF80_052590 [Liparis tanakae]|uniref:Uncharacterized protein n=1 Tax=Liparis tanakae TaxID=230148 RepID=A0A4Z2F7S1_9TELE|nr:hypothetical protein EYF80_052590 [Liparis tanakae]